MKITALLFTGALTCVAGMAQAQRYSTTSAERQANFDAAARSDARARAAAPINSSTPNSPSTYSSPSSSAGGVEDYFKAREEQRQQAAQAQAAKRAAERAAAERQAAAKRAAEEANAVKMATDMDEYRLLEAKRSALMRPFMQDGFNQGDARLMAYLVDGLYDPDPSLPVFLEELRQAQQAYQALYARPDATFEGLRALVQSLPRELVVKGRLGVFEYGLPTATGHCLQLWERFPAHRTAATSDLLAAAEKYFKWGRVRQDGFYTPDFQQQLKRGLLKIIAANQTGPEAPAFGARLAPLLLDQFFNYDADVAEQRIWCDPAQAVPLLRFAYTSSLNLVQHGPVANASQSQSQHRANSLELAARISRIAEVQHDWETTRQWALLALSADPQPSRLLVLLAEHPDLLPAMQAADWRRLSQALQLVDPLPEEDLTTWLTDTIAYYDHPRWQRLTPAERTSLAQARSALLEVLPRGFERKEQGPLYTEQLLPMSFPQGTAHLREKLATWTLVLSRPDSRPDWVAIQLWLGAARHGSVLGARNAYRAYLLRDRTTGVKKDMVQFPLNEFCRSPGSEAQRAEKRYLAALLLLDELPGYPPLGKANKEEGMAWLAKAKAAGSLAAAARLAR